MEEILDRRFTRKHVLSISGRLLGFVYAKHALVLLKYCKNLIFQFMRMKLFVTGLPLCLGFIYIVQTSPLFYIVDFVVDS